MFLRLDQCVALGTQKVSGCCLTCFRNRSIDVWYVHISIAGFSRPGEVSGIKEPVVIVLWGTCSHRKVAQRW